jgi:hypothetical protein
VRVARGAALAAAAAAACVLALGAAASAPGGTVTVTSDPALVPPFARGTPDHAVRCKAKTPVKLTFDAAGGTSVSVDGRAAKTGHSTASVKLRGGQALSFKVTGGPDAGTYHVRCVPVDFPRWTATVSGTRQAAFYVVTPIRLGYARPGYTIVFDRHGAPVWWMRDAKGSPFTGTPLPDGGIAWFPYQGTPFGIDKLSFEEHALDGSLIRTYQTVGTLTDHHELQVLPNHHVILVSYVPRDHVDLRPLNPSLPADATVVDGGIAEVDRHGTVKWSWSTHGHIGLKESSRWYQVKPVRLRDGRVAYDIVHLNSVDVHGERVVVSMRHTDAVYEIDKPTGNILWKLGGTETPQSLKFANDPLGGEAFGGQHDARLTPDGRYLTLFDNGTLRDRPPRALRYSIDTATGTATLLKSFGDPAVDESLCCGSARLLPGGDWVVSWAGIRSGEAFRVTETTPAGKPVLVLTFGGDRQSYRAIPILPGTPKASDFRHGMDAQAP